MKLKYITCSAMNENNDAYFVYITSAYYRKIRKRICPFLEIGVQVSGKRCSFGSPRYEWLMQIHSLALKHKKPGYFALHLNTDWVEKFCDGENVPELETLLNLKDHRGKPFFSRVQLNFQVDRNTVPPVEKLAEVLKAYTIPGRKFIVVYNDVNADYLQSLYKLFNKLDCLYNANFDEKIDKDWDPPCFGNVTRVVQGFAKNASPESVGKEIERIQKILPKNAVFSIDAEEPIKGENEPKYEDYLAMSCMFASYVYWEVYFWK